MTQVGLAVTLVFALVGTAFGEDPSWFKAKGSGLCVTQIASGPLTKGKAIVVGFDCTDKAAGWDGVSATQPTTGVMYEIPGLMATSKTDIKESEWENKEIVYNFGNPKVSNAMASEKMEDGMVGTMSTAAWADETGKEGLTIAVSNYFLADMGETKMDTVDLALTDLAGKLMEVKGVCIAHGSGGACGAKRSFGSPMVVTIFFGYMGFDVKWGDLKFLMVPKGFCMATDVRAYFNDDMDLTVKALKSKPSTNVKSITFYKFGSKTFLQYMIDEKYTTQEWTAPDKPTAKSEKSGNVVVRVYHQKNPDSTTFSGCFWLAIFLGKAELKAYRSFATMTTATTGEFAAKVEKGADGEKPKAKPKVAKVDGGEKGKTYAGVKAPEPKANGTANGTAAATAATAATSGASGVNPKIILGIMACLLAVVMPAW
jgi:hypothetical protein